MFSSFEPPGGLWWQGFFPGPSQRIPQLGFLTIWNEFLRFWHAPRPPIGAQFLIFVHTFFAVNSIFVFGNLGKVWAGVGGRGRGLPEPSDSEILTTYSTRPAPPEGGAANPKVFAPCRRPLIPGCWLADALAGFCWLCLYFQFALTSTVESFRGSWMAFRKPGSLTCGVV